MDSGGERPGGLPAGRSAPPRYSSRPFPAYRFIPGRSPHPRVDPAGHSHGMPEWRPEPVSPEKWDESDAWLYGVDLFNHGYWWEAHEVLEGLWHAAGRTTSEARFLQGLIQIAAGCLKREMGEAGGAQRLLEAGLEKVAAAPDRWLGVNVREFEAAVRGYQAVVPESGVNVRESGVNVREFGAARRLAGGERPDPPLLVLEGS